MKWFNDLRIATKLPVIFCLLAAITGVTGWIGYSKVGRLKDSGARLYAERLVAIQDLAYASFAFLNARTDLRDLLLATDASAREDLAESIQGYSQTIDQRIGVFRQRPLVQREQEMLQVFETARDHYQRLRGPVIALATGGETAKAAAALQDRAFSDAQVEARKRLSDLIDFNVELANEEDKANRAAASAARAEIAVFIGVGVLLALALGLLLARRIGRPLQAMQSAAEQLPQGDVNVRVDLDTADELGALAHSFRVMIETIRVRATLAQRIAAGGLAVDVRQKSEQDLLGKSFVAGRGDAAQTGGGSRGAGRVRGSRQAGRARQSGPVSGWLPQDCGGSEPHAGRSGDAAERGGESCGADQQRRSAARDHRHLSGRIQHHQEQPEHAHRRDAGGDAGGLRDRAGESDGPGAGAQRRGQTDAGAGSRGLGFDPHGDRDPQHRSRSGFGEPGHQHGLARGVERSERAGGVGRGSVELDGGDGIEQQAERRQRAADR